MLESSRNEVEIEGMDLKTLELILEFIYKGEVDFPLDSQEQIALIDGAEKYQLEGLKTSCFLKMFPESCNYNIGEMAMVAHHYNLNPVITKSIKDYCKR